MNNDKIIAQIADEIARLTEFHKRLVAGEELCDYRYNYSDRCFETFCSCGKHIGERYEISDVPFKSDAYCCRCRGNK